jgi:hypothetical protein
VRVERRLGNAGLVDQPLDADGLNPLLVEQAAAVLRIRSRTESSAVGAAAARRVVAMA